MMHTDDDYDDDDQEEVKDAAEKLARKIMRVVVGYEARTVLIALARVLQHIGLQA